VRRSRRSVPETLGASSSMLDTALRVNYCETRCHSVVSFFIQPVSYQQLSQLTHLIPFERANFGRLQVEPFRDVFSRKDVMAACDTLAATHAIQKSPRLLEGYVRVR
jgi:hypothetical protein